MSRVEIQNPNTIATIVSNIPFLAASTSDVDVDVDASTSDVDADVDASTSCCINSRY